MTNIQWILPVLFILLGLLAGIVGEKVIYERLKNFSSRKKIPGSEIIMRSLHRMIFLWFVLAGCFSAILIHPHVNHGVNLDVLQKILFTIFLYSVTLVLARLSSNFINLFIRKTGGNSASLFSNIAKTSVFGLGTLIILQTLGVKITPIITTLGISGLAVGLALKDTLENLFAGFHLIFSKQVRTGDYVKLDGGHEGYVTDITWRNTTIREVSNNAIIVPNSKLASAIFINCHLLAKESTLTVNVGVNHDSDLENVERITVEVAKDVMQQVSPKLVVHEPFIRFQKFGETSIDFTVFMRVNDFFDQRIARHLFIKALHKRFKIEGIKTLPTSA
ncbi:mechanosensitive ion channel family protein [Calothrix sp. UHCC 0171]|uniref:mechanosensitive ion channel family protein n=1 Tax=Calothrix sp. UHCC 0171 TaxID=3110245 RepID=UPI002B20E306|nr:mechanosensitive ion channel domain-containing protein [Calothrix sp. UHCC 0171]MEA5570339.1 mechanosensitive ion channel domain-containing protein [Calothrix sp. UHCC 0171]